MGPISPIGSFWSLFPYIELIVLSFLCSTKLGSPRGHRREKARAAKTLLNRSSHSSYPTGELQSPKGTSLRWIPFNKYMLHFYSEHSCWHDWISGYLTREEASWPPRKQFFKIQYFLEKEHILEFQKIIKSRTDGLSFQEIIAYSVEKNHTIIY